jgi:hypothetical protein
MNGPLSNYTFNVNLRRCKKGKGGPLQDILRLLTLWFNHGAAPEVEAALMVGPARYRSPHPRIPCNSPNEGLPCRG